LARFSATGRSDSANAMQIPAYSPAVRQMDNRKADLRRITAARCRTRQTKYGGITVRVETERERERERSTDEERTEGVDCVLAECDECEAAEIYRHCYYQRLLLLSTGTVAALKHNRRRLIAVTTSNDNAFSDRLYKLCKQRIPASITNNARRTANCIQTIFIARSTVLMFSTADFGRLLQQSESAALPIVHPQLVGK